MPQTRVSPTQILAHHTILLMEEDAAGHTAVERTDDVRGESASYTCMF